MFVWEEDLPLIKFKIDGCLISHAFLEKLRIVSVRIAYFKRGLREEDECVWM